MSDNKVIQLILVDDHRRVHQALSEMIEFFDDIEILAHGSNGQEAIELVAKYHPDLVLMDVVMPEMDGVEATKRIMQQYPDTKILALSSFKDSETARAMLENGAVGYLLKNSSVDDLENTIRSALEGQGILSPEIMQALLEKPKANSEDAVDIPEVLSQREIEVLKLFATGLTNGEIAAKLTISTSTVKFHITNILNKMGVETRAEAIVIAAKNGIV